MTQELVKRRLVVGPVMAAMFVYGLTAMSKAMGWEGAALPSILGGGLGSFVIAWYLVRSERPQAHRPITQVRVGVIVAAALNGMLLIRLGPPVLVYGVLVAGLAMSLGLVISSGCELLHGTYADTPGQDRR
ncbi:MAG: hypothetical protein ACRDPJ_08180 [Nocardioidaceae bacterium]